MVLYIPFKALKVGKQKFQILAASSSQPLHTKRGRKPRSKEAPLLFVDEIEPITSTSLLTSGHINLAMQYISAQFPHIGGSHYSWRVTGIPYTNGGLPTTNHP